MKFVLLLSLACVSLSSFAQDSRIQHCKKIMGDLYTGKLAEAIEAQGPGSYDEPDEAYEMRLEAAVESVKKYADLKSKGIEICDGFVR